MTFNVLPTKSGRARRRLVYLDQNVASDLCKLRLGRDPEAPRKSALEKLSASLRESVFEKQTARCVESLFHRAESAPLNEELFQEIWRFTATHSWGLRLRSFREVMEFQTLVSVAAATGLHRHDPSYLWRGGFESDPDARNERAGVRVGGENFVISVPWEPQTLNARNVWASSVEPLRAKGMYATLDDALTRILAESRESTRDESQRHSWSTNWSFDSQMQADDVTHFIASEAFAQVPLIDVQAQIYARFLSDSSRRLKENDSVDAWILALAIPYCDLVVTDKYMAALCSQAQFESKYGTKVLPATDAGLAVAADWLTALK